MKLVVQCGGPELGGPKLGPPILELGIQRSASCPNRIGCPECGGPELDVRVPNLGANDTTVRSGKKRKKKTQPWLLLLLHHRMLDHRMLDHRLLLMLHGETSTRLDRVLGMMLLRQKVLPHQKKDYTLLMTPTLLTPMPSSRSIRRRTQTKCGRSPSLTVTDQSVGPSIPFATSSDT